MDHRLEGLGPRDVLEAPEGRQRLRPEEEDLRQRREEHKVEVAEHDEPRAPQRPPHTLVGGTHPRREGASDPLRARRRWERPLIAVGATGATGAVEPTKRRRARHPRRRDRQQVRTATAALAGARSLAGLVLGGPPVVECGARRRHVQPARRTQCALHHDACQHFDQGGER